MHLGELRSILPPNVLHALHLGVEAKHLLSCRLVHVHLKTNLSINLFLLDSGFDRGAVLAVRERHRSGGAGEAVLPAVRTDVQPRPGGGGPLRGALHERGVVDRGQGEGRHGGAA